MAFLIELHRSPDNANWTRIAYWDNVGGGSTFVDFANDSPGAGVWYYRIQATSNYAGDVVGPRGITVIAGNR